MKGVASLFLRPVRGAAAQESMFGFLAVLRLPPWEEIAVAAILWLEVPHPARPWHTAALGAGLTAYLLAVHVAESRTSPGRLLRRQGAVLTAGACLVALGAGVATLPAPGPARAQPCSACSPPPR